MALTPCLMFIGQAEQALDFYLSTFPDAELLHLECTPPDDAGTEGTVAAATFRIADLTLRCIDSPDVHAFDVLVERLSDGGCVLMAPGQYPFARRFAWLNVKVGVSWQLSVANDE